MQLMLNLSPSCSRSVLFALMAATHVWGQPRVLQVQAQLEGGEWVDLLGPGHQGIAEVKWCANRFTPFLCIGPNPAATAGKMDAEEFIEVCTCLWPWVYAWKSFSDDVCQARSSLTVGFVVAVRLHSMCTQQHQRCM